MDEPDLPAETGAEAVYSGDLPGAEELEAAQRESIEEAVQATLAAERQKSQAQQEPKRDDRVRILGTAAAGLAAGAFLHRIGAMLVGPWGDRMILQQDPRQMVRHDVTARNLLEGRDSAVECFADGLSLVLETRADGICALSWRDASGQVERRVAVLPDGSGITLFDGTEAAAEQEMTVTELPPIRREDQRRDFLSGASAEEFPSMLPAQPVAAVGPFHPAPDPRRRPDPVEHPSTERKRGEDSHAARPAPAGPKSQPSPRWRDLLALTLRQPARRLRSRPPPRRRRCPTCLR
jgi:hypothetical protein